MDYRKNIIALLFGVALILSFASASRAEGTTDPDGPRGTGGAVDPSLVLSEASAVGQKSGRNPTLAFDSHSGTVYLAWAQEVRAAPSDAASAPGKKHDPKLQVLLARSQDGGRHFGAPVVVSGPNDKVKSHTVSPAQVAVGQKGEVYVLYGCEDADYARLGTRSRNLLRLARSDDGGRTFAEPVEVASETVEGAIGSPGMINLFVAPDGSLYASWLDYRETFDYIRAHKALPPKGEQPPTQLRVARSVDGGRSFEKSILVTKPVCGCCGTKVAQGTNGPLYASTRAAWPELKGSVDAVRDIVVAASNDHGKTWSDAVKTHDDRFKISGCPDVAPGLSVDSKGRLHAAWYTGTEKNPGIFYAVSTDQGRSFSVPVALLTDEWVPYADVKLVLDEKDNAWVAFEDRRGETDLIHLLRIAEDGHISRAVPWPGTIPDLTAAGDSVVIGWGKLAPADQDDRHGGGIELRIARPGTGS
jgi:hypothetical protein